MRFALIVAFVGSVFFHMNAAEARSGAVPAAEARKAPKAKKRPAKGTKTKARARVKKAKHKVSKRPRKTPVEAREDVATTDDAEAPASVPEVVAPAPSWRPAVAQTTDDEDPGPAPKRRW